jgi:signal transduction histidine kinase/DNA-binding NarL/FixJ family response regulator
LDEEKALLLRIKRERAARLEAESLLEIKSRELHAAVKESRRLTRQLEKTVELQTQELLSAQRVTKLGTFVWDITENSFSWSEGSREVLDLDQSTTRNSFEEFLAAIHPDDRHIMQHISEILHQSVESGDKFVIDTEKTFRLKQRGEDIRWIKFVCDSTDFKFFSGAVQDITESVVAAKDVRQARTELESRLADLEKTQHKLRVAHEEAQTANATKSRFIAMISHDIRTPINGLLGTLTLLADSELESSQRELLQVATSSAELLRVLVNDVLDFARLETGQIQLEPANFNIRDLVSQLIDFWSPLATSAENRLEANIDDCVPGVLRGDPIRLGQVFNNLLSNAIKFTSSGVITLNIRADDSRAYEKLKEHLIIEVADTGIGIEKNDQVHLFKDFSQIPLEHNEEEQYYDLSSSRRGAGLGLAICRTLVEQMGGKISVTSFPGKGSTFCIRMALEAVSDAAPSENPIEYPPLVTVEGRAPSVLVAEDVPANQLVSRMLLQSFGCQVDIANDGVEAVAACKKRKYDFVLMDVSMPRLDGIAATQQIRCLKGSGFEKLPIIGLTAFAFAHEKQRFIEAGMNEVVCKPVRREHLYEAARNAVDGRNSTESGEDTTKKTSAINLDVLRALISGLSDEQVRKVMQQVSDDLDKYRDQAIADAKSGNIIKLSRSCHAIKGLAASFGSQDLASLASSIEGAAREGDFELAVANTLDRLDFTTDETLNALKNYQALPDPLSNAG